MQSQSVFKTLRNPCISVPLYNEDALEIDAASLAQEVVLSFISNYPSYVNAHACLNVH